jgi:Hg(II)-responsive transcriptional regulator
MVDTLAPLTIGKVAHDAGVGVETIRFYERKGLIARPHRPQRGFRSYPPETAQRIRFVRQAQELGFTLREIKDLLSLRADPTADCSEVRRKSQEKLANVIAKSRQLDSIRRALEALIAACPGRGAIRTCSILDGLAEPARQVATAEPDHMRNNRGGRSTMKTYVIAIEGMHCAGCVDTVKTLLEMEAGVKAASVSLQDGAARVLVDPATAKPERLASVVKRAGYKATLRAP